MVFLYGATGFTGRLTAFYLSKYVEIFLGGRNEEKLKKLSNEIWRKNGNKPRYFVLSADEIKNFDFKKFGIKVIINTAGPFSEIGEKILLSAINSSIHYLDSTGEAKFMIEMFKKYNEEVEKKKILVVEGCAFESVAGEIAVRKLGQELKRIFIFYLSPFHMSAGTIQSALHILKKNIWWNGYDWVEGGFEKKNFNGKILFSVPTAEIATVPRMIPKGIEFKTFIAISKKLQKFIPLAIKISQNDILREVVKKIIDFIPPPSEKKREKDEIEITAIGEKKEGEEEKVVLKVRDPYGITAKILGEGAKEILNQNKNIYGILPPTSAFPKIEKLLH